MQGVSAPRVNPRMSSPFYPQWRPGYEEDCGGGDSQDRSGLMTLQRLLYHRRLASSQNKPWKCGSIPHTLPRWPFWCWGSLSFSVSPSLPLSLRPTPTHSVLLARLATDELKVCQSAGWEGRKERHQKEFIQRVFPITWLFALSREFDGLFGSSLRLSPSFLPSMIWLSWNQSPFVLILWTVCSDG